MSVASTGRGRLVRRVPFRLLDVSLSGCLIETEHRFGVGTPGTLYVELWGVSCRYPVRVIRVAERTLRPGRIRLAAEFAWGRAAQPGSSEDRTVSPDPRHRGPARLLAFDPDRHRARL